MNTPIAIIAKNLVKERLRKGLSQGELARQAGVAKSTLSQLEAGNGNPSIETLWSLCVPLGISFANLMMEPHRSTQLVRRGQGLTVAAEQADYQAILLATSPLGVRRDIYQVESQPGKGRHSRPHLPGSVEHIIITHGRALVGLSERPVELNVGDYLSYPADQEHLFQALEPDTRAIMMIDHI
ncbi:DNA-binding transcriptional regulator, XRE-family HTH domain [Izhakiella capsodis]|uniref:DNA-binding transcriptional regulator, XRE-family HTH domain n=1 Tax=Izhakiella capsodis TaxID=1367852 RepID=A0A1I4UQ80_9GAMM|nr:helix-turn-helix domain-containing protein [Izhakiella capsodis]SFM91098.1 DNA-binding transcriptional regulator, XRE-family HTH domain [Izhakiella capsodis]